MRAYHPEVSTNALPAIHDPIDLFVGSPRAVDDEVIQPMDAVVGSHPLGPAPNCL
jgi:hypothetical protein